MDRYLNQPTLKIYRFLFIFIISFELILNGWNLFISLDNTVLSTSIRELFAEILLLLSIFSGFLFILFNKNKKLAVLYYLKFLIFSFIAYLYIICRFAFLSSTNEKVAILLNGTIISEPSMFNSKILISCLGLLFLSVVYLDTVHNSFTALELPFLLALTL